MTAPIRCHYEVLDVPRDANAAAIKKSYRRLVLRHHPDKNVGKTVEEFEKAAREFKFLQAAYECLSDPVERKWYDEHRDMILRGGVDAGGGAEGGDGSSFLYDVTSYQYAGCYDGYEDEDPESFYAVYNSVFEQIFQGEKDGFLSEGNIDLEEMSNSNLSDVHLGNSTADWEDVMNFYGAWEGFSSCLCFAWEDYYQLEDIREAPNRRTRRLMEEDNKKRRKAAKRSRAEDVGALVRFVKKRDPRVKARRESSLREQAAKEKERKEQAAQRKKDIAAAKEAWRTEAEQRMAEQEAADRTAGRTRLADLDDDDHDYGGKRGRRKKGKRKGGGGKGRAAAPKQDREDAASEDGDDKISTDREASLAKNGVHRGEEEKASESATPSSKGDPDIREIATNEEEDICIALNEAVVGAESSEEEEDEPDSWRCECCRKDFKSQKQFENHERSKKHKETVKKYEKKLREEAKGQALGDMMEEIKGGT